MSPSKFWSASYASKQCELASAVFRLVPFSCRQYRGLQVFSRLEFTVGGEPYPHPSPAQGLKLLSTGTVLGQPQLCPVSLLKVSGVPEY